MKRRFSFWSMVMLLVLAAVLPVKAETVRPLLVSPSSHDAGLLPAVRTAPCLQGRDDLSALEIALREEAYIGAWEHLGVGKSGIHVNLRWSYVTGKTDPNVNVDLTLRSNTGVFKDQVMTKSASTGGYFAAFSFCNPVVPGDTVSLRTEGGRFQSTTVVPLTGWINPTNETVGGMTVANRNVEVAFYQAEDTCALETSVKQVSSSAAGAYLASFASSRDIRRYSRTDVWVYDANGHSTFAPFEAPHIQLTKFGDLSVTLAPNQNSTATLSSGGVVSETVTGKTDNWGDVYLFLTNDPRQGDHIEVSDGTTTLSYDVAPLTLTKVDLAANRVEGTTAPNLRMEAALNSERRSTCEDEYVCHVFQSDADGTFNIHTGNGAFDLSPGDEMLFHIFDGEGNWQNVERHPRQIQVNLDDRSVTGFWDRPDVPLHVLLKDTGGSVRESQIAASRAGTGSISVHFQQPLTPGDWVVIGDGHAITDTVEIALLTVYANGQTNRISGQAPANRSLLLDGSKGCTVVNVSGSSMYNAGLDGANLQAGDRVTAFYFDNNGSTNTTRTHATQINTTLDDDVVMGYVERPTVPVSVTLRAQDNTLLAGGVYTSTSDGHYVAILSGGDPISIAEGYKINVQGEGGVPASLTVPHLDVQIDPQGNQIYGRTLPAQPVSVSASRGFLLLGYINTTSDASGDYVASFEGKKTYTCEPVQLGSCTEATVKVTTADGHEVTRDTPAPVNVSADMYEVDNTAATATNYTDLQSHTFHQFFDVDWVKFPVTGDDVGKDFTLATANHGANMDTIVSLYDTDGTSLLAQAGAFSGAKTAVIHHRFDGMGTYYLKIEPASLANTRMCGSTYDVVIGSRSIYLPVQFKKG